MKRPGRTRSTAPLYVSIGDVAAEVGVCADTVRKWIRSRLVKSIRVGRVLRVSRKSLDELLTRSN